MTINERASMSEDSRPQYIGMAGTNITTFNRNPFDLETEFGTDLVVVGGSHSELPASVIFLNHGGTSRWRILDNPPNYFEINRASAKSRILLYKGRDEFVVASAVRAANVVTITTTTPHLMVDGTYVIVKGSPVVTSRSTSLSPKRTT